MEEFKQILKGLFITLGIIAVLIAAVAIYESYRDYIDRSQASVGVQAGSYNRGSSQLAETDYDDLSIPSVNEKDEYRKMMFGDMPRGTPVVFIGKVDQVVQGNELRVATGTFAASSLQELFFSGVQFVDRHVLISLSASPRALVGDYIAVKGIYTGTVEYKSILGSIVKVPAITADYYEADSSMPALDDFFAGRLSAKNQLREQQENERRQAAQQIAQLPTVGSEFDPENGVTEEEEQLPIKQKYTESEVSEIEPMTKRSDVDVGPILEQAEKDYVQPAYRELQKEAQTNGINMSGKRVVLYIEVSPSGKVSKTRIESTDLNNSDFEGEIVAIIKSLEFESGNFEVWSGYYEFIFPAT